jgi:hypothetical protein
MSEDLQDQNVRYATLSYCWGNANIRTTRENEKLHKQEIPYKSIPPTLRDAMTLTREPNIQFLWIDALCIVQDDHAEWETEASRMQDFYSGSSITIAATDAADSSAGFLPHKPSGEYNLDETSAFLHIRNIIDGHGAVVRVQRSDIRTSKIQCSIVRAGCCKN